MNDQASPNHLAAAIQRAGLLLKNSHHAIVFTGAGISTPSGIPDFRSKNTGMWERFNPMEVASLGVFQSHPERFYNWVRPLLREIWQAQPNPAHLALAQLEQAGILKAVITQNIDNLHQRAGSQNIYEVHGSLRSITCVHCRKTYPSEQFKDRLEANAEIPRCPQCSRILKPDITLFGEMLPEDIWLEAEEHCRKADVVLVVGSSLEVWPAASLPEMGARNGANLIINNLTSTFMDPRAAVLIPLDVAEAVPAIAKAAIQS